MGLQNEIEAEKCHINCIVMHYVYIYFQYSNESFYILTSKTKHGKSQNVRVNNLNG